MSLVPHASCLLRRRFRSGLLAVKDFSVHEAKNYIFYGTSLVDHNYVISLPAWDRGVVSDLCERPPDVHGEDLGVLEVAEGHVDAPAEVVPASNIGGSSVVGTLVGHLLVGVGGEDDLGGQGRVWE